MDANQSRIRVGTPSSQNHLSVSVSSDGITDVRRFTYQPLEPEEDSIRLLQIQQADDYNAPLVCTLSHMTFGESPQYQALSYMWGDKTIEKQISLNGKAFLVRENLWDALHYLRYTKKDVSFWIDAICINQYDVPERNRQVRKMHHIYMRARVVLIWLGLNHIDPPRWGDPWNPYRMKTERIEENGYWDRLWIVQEIGYADTLEICTRSGWMSWVHFIATHHDTTGGARGPRKFQKQIEEKKLQGYTLQTLVEMHKDAKCENPRDKIYGLIGLAANCREKFPVDYDKSLFEVWKDTITFIHNKSKPASQARSTSFERLVKHALGSNKIETVEKIAQEYARDPASYRHVTPHSAIKGEDDSDDLIRLHAQVVGRIVYVGPTPLEITNSTNATDQWLAKISENYPKELGEADQEAQDLIRRIVNPTELNLSMVSRVPSKVLWYGDFSQGGPLYEHLWEEERLKFPPEPDNRPPAPNPPPISSDLSPQEPCLFQLRSLPSAKPMRIGIAPRGSQIGDLICRIENIQKNILLRMVNGWLYIVGTVAGFKDLVPQKVTPLVRFESPVPFHRQSSGKELELFMDPETAYIIIS